MAYGDNRSRGRDSRGGRGRSYGGRGSSYGGRPRGGFSGPSRGGFSRGPREMHKATCAACGKECEVPFKPTEGRPVYCKECFLKQKGIEPRAPRPERTIDESADETEETEEVEEADESDEEED